jgi:hypothetical protein
MSLSVSFVHHSNLALTMWRDYTSPVDRKRSFFVKRKLDLAKRVSTAYREILSEEDLHGRSISVATGIGVVQNEVRRDDERSW